MLLTSPLVAAIPLAIWLYLGFLRGNFWRLEDDHLEPKSLRKWPHVVAIVPARNEAETIARAVTSLLGQDYPGEFSVIVVDDQSDDGTAALSRKAAEELGADAPYAPKYMACHPKLRPQIFPNRAKAT